MKIFPRLLLTLILVVFYTQSYAVKIVRIQVDYSGVTRTLDLELYDDEIDDPINTVNNFLNYVNDGRYDGTFIYRNAPGFVIQTGGYTYRPADPLTDFLEPISAGTGLELVPKDSSVVNEFKYSNVRGTLALAKLSTSPDSGSSEWFINLADNSENLDNQNGGFTVFGSVIDNSMVEIVDEIAAFPIQGFAGQVLGQAFAQLPVIDYDFTLLIPPPVFQANLAMLTSFTVISRPIIKLTPSFIDFGLDIENDGQSALVTATIRNAGDETLDIGAIGNLSAPYNVISDNCSNATLVPQTIDANSTCSIDITFSASAAILYESNLNIPYTSQIDASAFTISYSITGDGVPATPVNDTSTTEIIFADTAINSTTNETITVRNKGGGTLTITAINLTGSDSNQYAVDGAGCVVGTSLTISQTCTLTISFTPTSGGPKNAILEIQTNDITSSVTLTGTATEPQVSVNSSVNLFAQLNQTAEEFVFLSNSGTGNLILNSITITGSGAPSFSELNNCPDTNNSGTPTQNLGANQVCAIIVEFTPTDDLVQNAILTIESNDPVTPLVEIVLTGSTSNPIISAVSSFDVGIAEANGAPLIKELIITNNGLAPLEISTITALGSTDISETNNCTDTQILFNNTCSMFVTFTATTVGIITATITINSNDPVTPSLVINVSGIGDTDSDGIISSVEQLAPNSGDGNNDNITDDIQNNVASFTVGTNTPITLVSDNAKLLLTNGLLSNVEPITALYNINIINIPDEFPKDEAFDLEVYDFTVRVEGNIAVGTSSIHMDIGVFLPAGTGVEKYYRFVPTPDNPVPHLYDFTFNSTTGLGARSLGTVTIQSSTGASITRDLIIISYVDGGLGDDDLTMNGIIENSAGGFTTDSQQTSNGDSSGSMSIYYLLLLIMLYFIKSFARNLSTRKQH